MSVLIRPIKNSKTFFGEASILQGIMSRDANGVLVDTDDKKELGTYSKERFHGSQQILRGAVWSKSKSEYNIGPITDEDLNRLVARCGLYTSKGEPITSANRRRFGDPFFNHPEFKINLLEGEQELDTKGNPLHELLYMGFKQRSQFRNDITNPYTSARARYELVEKGSENTVDNEAFDLWADVGALIKGLDDEKTLKLAIILKVGAGENPSPSEAKKVLGRALQANKLKGPNGFDTIQKAFVDLCTMDEEKFNLHYYVIKAIQKGYIRRRKDQGFTYNGKPIATMQSQIIEYFLDPTNQEDFFELENLVGDTRRSSSS